MKIPSEEINKAGEKAELDWLKEYNERDYQLKLNAFIRLLAEHNYMKKFIDEIYKTLNKSPLPAEDK